MLYGLPAVFALHNRLGGATCPSCSAGFQSQQTAARLSDAAFPIGRYDRKSMLREAVGGGRRGQYETQVVLHRANTDGPMNQTTKCMAKSM